MNDTAQKDDITDVAATVVVEKSQTKPAEQEESTATKGIIIPRGWPDEVFRNVQKSLKNPDRQRGLVFENEKQRNAMAIRKGLTKPGRIGYDTLRRIAMSVYAARICINSLKSKVTKTQWIIQPIDQTKRKKDAKSDKRIKEVTDFFKHPNGNNETFRTLMDKCVEDLLVLDAVSMEKTRYPDGTLAELFFVDSATIRPVYDDKGNQDIIVPLPIANEDGEADLPVSYLQILNNSQYGGPESGDIVAAWPKKDFIHFHMHPQGSMEGFGYGLSPLEAVLSVMSNLLNSDNFNSTYFEEGAFPPILINVVGQVNQRDMEAFKEYFYQEINGNFHRPMFMASQQKSDVINLKELNNRDMQFMEYTMWLCKMCCAIFEMSPDDIGITDTTGSKNVSETQKSLSEDKGYSSILDLFKQIFNQEIVWKDFGYEDLEFDWVAKDDIDPDKASQIDDRNLRNGSVTMNEIRQERGAAPYGSEWDQPMLLGTNGYQPLQAPEESEQGEDPKEVGGEKPYKEQDTDEDVGEKVTKSQIVKSVFTPGGYKTWADDRGYSQPFIYCYIQTGEGRVIKPPVAVNLQSQTLEIDLTNRLASMGLNVRPVTKMTYVEIVNALRGTPELLAEFMKYCDMVPEYDSEKWRALHGGSRKFPYYLVSDYVDGYSLDDPMLIRDMQRDPDSYVQATKDLAAMWRVEKELVLGDRRANQYVIGHDKRAYGFDYQFEGDLKRWEKTKQAIPYALETVPELSKVFDVSIKGGKFSLKSALKNLIGKK